MVGERIKAGITTEEINKWVHDYTVEHGAYPAPLGYHGFPKSTCVSVNEVVCHGIPSEDKILKDGDIVKITTANDAKPRQRWLKIVKTSGAKNRIKAYFSKQDRSYYIENGKYILDKEMKKRKIAVNEVLNEDNLAKIFKYLKIQDLDELYLGIGTLKYLPGYIIDLNNQTKNEKDPLINSANRFNKVEEYNGDIIVCGIDNVRITVASCCKPIKGDKIVGYITKGRGISIHRQDCPNIINTKDRVIDVCWNTNTNNYYYTDLLVETDNLNDNLMDILSKSGQKDLHIESVTKKELNNGINYNLNIKLKDIKELESYIKDLEKVKYIIKVSRRNN
jgi:GTP pyrophosphokinase